MDAKIKQKIVELFVDKYYSCNMIAKEVGYTRAYICNILNSAGYDTSKRPIPITCDNCGKTFYNTRAIIRKSVKHFCSKRCYYEHLQKQSNYIENRAGQKRVRKVLQKIIPGFKQEYIIHHKDGNDNNDDINNIIIFKNQAYHLKHHRLNSDDGIVCDCEKLSEDDKISYYKLLVRKA